MLYSKWLKIYSWQNSERAEVFCTLISASKRFIWAITRPSSMIYIFPKIIRGSAFQTPSTGGENSVKKIGNQYFYFHNIKIHLKTPGHQVYPHFEKNGRNTPPPSSSATIRTRQKIQCLPSARFFYSRLFNKLQLTANLCPH